MKNRFKDAAAAIAVILALFAALFVFTLKRYYITAAAPVSAPLTKGVTLVLDPGHGGEDGGAVSVTGTHEASINLAISLKAEQLAAFLGYPPVMTRTSDTIEYPQDAATIRARKVADQKARVALINSMDDAFLISIHQNKYTSSGPFGAQVLYKDGAEEFGAAMQELFISQLNGENRRTAARVSDDIYLTKAANCPALLIECGFLSHPEEAPLLEDENYQTKLAMLITGAFSNYSKQP